MAIPATRGADSAGVDAAGAAGAAAATCLWWGLAAQQVALRTAAKLKLTRTERTMVSEYPNESRLVYGNSD